MQETLPARKAVGSKANETKCVKDEDCAPVSCEGAGDGIFYCDKNGFSRCGKDSKCECILTCL